MKYSLDSSQVTSIKQAEQLMEVLIKNETRAEVEVTILHDKVLVYTESLGRIELIKRLMEPARAFMGISEYEADEDFPAGATLSFSA